MASSSSKTREPLASLEDLRDDCVAVVLNSKQTFTRVHEKGGPTPQTISRWLYRETRFPQLATVRAMLKACDHDLAIVNSKAKIKRINPEGDIQMPDKASPQAIKLRNSVRQPVMIAGQRAKKRKAARRK